MGQLSSQVRGKTLLCGFQSIATNVTTSKSSLRRLGFQTLVINRLPFADHLRCHVAVDSVIIGWKDLTDFIDRHIRTMFQLGLLRFPGTGRPTF